MGHVNLIYYKYKFDLTPSVYSSMQPVVIDLYMLCCCVIPHSCSGTADVFASTFHM